MSKRSTPLGIAKFDSASVMLRALARFLHGRDFPALGQPRALQHIVRFADRLPRHLRERLFALGGALEGVRPEHVDRVSAAKIAAWMCSLYPQRRYPAVALGSSSGALVHLCAALGTPWLPQTFLTLIRQKGVHPDEARDAMEAGREPSQRILAENPDVQLHHMHDPNQDRLMLGCITYLRMKHRRLPLAYRAFLERSLEPGGTVILFECERGWPVTRLAERWVYQFGALGGATLADYFEGSERIEAYLARYGSHRRRWDPPSPDGESPEAEWGFEPTLREDVAALARERGWRVVRVRAAEPERLSPLNADLYRRWYRERGLVSNRLVAESFIVLEPYWALRTGSVPFWMKFNKEPSLDWIRQYLSEAEPFDHVHLTLFAHGINSVGLPPIEMWRAVLGYGRESGSFLGVDEEAYPAHFGVFAKYHLALRRIPARYSLPEPLTLGQFARDFRETGGSDLVRVDGLDF